MLTPSPHSSSSQAIECRFNELLIAKYTVRFSIFGAVVVRHFVLWKRIFDPAKAGFDKCREGLSHGKRFHEEVSE